MCLARISLMVALEEGYVRIECVQSLAWIGETVAEI